MTYSNCSRTVKSEKIVIDRKLEASDKFESCRQALLSVRQKMMFGTNLNDFKGVINTLPDGYYFIECSYVGTCLNTLPQVVSMTSVDAHTVVALKQFWENN